MALHDILAQKCCGLFKKQHHYYSSHFYSIYVKDDEGRVARHLQPDAIRFDIVNYFPIFYMKHFVLAVLADDTLTCFQSIPEYGENVLTAILKNMATYFTELRGNGKPITFCFGNCRVQQLNDCAIETTRNWLIDMGVSIDAANPIVPKFEREDAFNLLLSHGFYYSKKGKNRINDGGKE
jgi:hypothetical protein